MLLLKLQQDIVQCETVDSSLKYCMLYGIYTLLVNLPLRF
jgi:hypothetical protein